MQLPTLRRSIVYNADGKPAYSSFKGRVTQTMVNFHGSYDAARAWLNSQGEQP